MIPDFDEHGNLPPGVHWAAWEDFAERFATTPHRRELLNGLEAAIAVLAAAGCRSLYVDGSFVTRKEHPNDYDACWDTEGVDAAQLVRLEPLFIQFRHSRAEQKAQYGGEFFPVWMGIPAGREMFVRFQRDKEGNEKGSVALPIGRQNDHD